MKRHTLLILTLLLVTGVISVLLFTPHQKLLTDGAAQVASVPFLTFKTVPPTSMTASYAWTSNTELLYLRNTQPCRFDTRTGQTILPGRNISTSGATGIINKWEMSADRSRLLTMQFVLPKKNAPISRAVPTIIRLSPQSCESSMVTFALPPPPRDQYGAMLFLPANHHIAVFTWDANGKPYWLVYDENSPATPKRVPSPDSSLQGNPIAILLKGNLLTSTNEVLTYCEDDSVYNQTPPRQQYSQFSLRRYTFGTTTAPTVTSFATPFGGDLEAKPLAVSPDGTRTLWKAKSYIGWKRQIANSILPLLPKRSPVISRISYEFIQTPTSNYWISDIDGSNFRKLGSLQTNDPLCDFGLSWLPDSKHISFIVDGKLWVRPVL